MILVDNGLELLCHQKCVDPFVCMLRRWHQLIVDHTEDLAAILTAEMGRPLAQPIGVVGAITPWNFQLRWWREANDTTYGLAAYFYASNLKRVWQVAETLEYGMVGINTGCMFSEAAPFGGIKQSGIGREGSRHGIEDYLEMKYICVGGI